MPSAPVDRVDDVIRRLLQGRGVGRGDVDLDVARAEPAAAAGDGDRAGVVELGDRGLHLFAERDLVGVRDRS